MSKHNDLWAAVLKEGTDIFDQSSNKANYTSLVLVGPQKSGKSTLIHSFLDKDDEPKPSLPVEYTYVRRTNKHMVKDVCYVWEIDIENISFVQELINGEGLEKISILLVTDLTRSHDLWNACASVEDFLKPIKDTQVLITFGIIGMKYDLFENQTTEKKMTICRVLKHYATILEGPLIFCSKLDRTTVKVAKDLFSHLAFNARFSYQLRFDLNSAIIVPKGLGNKSELGYLNQTFETQFGQMPPTRALQNDDPGEDANYLNEKIDNRKRIF